MTDDLRRGVRRALALGLALVAAGCGDSSDPAPTRDAGAPAPPPTAGEGATCESCAHCPWMGMNSLQNLEQVLSNGGNEIHIDAALRDRAVKPIQRMLDFAREHGSGGKK